MSIRYSPEPCNDYRVHPDLTISMFNTMAIWPKRWPPSPAWIRASIATATWHPICIEARPMIFPKESKRFDKLSRPTSRSCAECLLPLDIKQSRLHLIPPFSQLSISVTHWNDQVGCLIPIHFAYLPLVVRRAKRERYLMLLPPPFSLRNCKTYFPFTNAGDVTQSHIPPR